MVTQTFWWIRDLNRIYTDLYRSNWTEESLIKNVNFSPFSLAFIIERNEHDYKKQHAADQWYMETKP